MKVIFEETPCSKVAQGVITLSTKLSCHSQFQQ